MDSVPPEPAGPPRGWRYDRKGRLRFVRGQNAAVSDALLNRPMPWATAWVTLFVAAAILTVLRVGAWATGTSLPTIQFLTVAPALGEYHRHRVRHRWWAAACAAVALLLVPAVLGTAAPELGDGYPWDIGALCAPLAYAAATHLPRRDRRR